MIKMNRRVDKSSYRGPHRPFSSALMLGTIVMVTILTGSYAKFKSNARNQLASRKTISSTFVELADAAGYKVEEHEVTTKDKYILRLHRINGGPASPVARGKPPVLLLHGIFGASDVWIMRGPNHDLAYSLVDNGYDVWALNVRGNYYSKRHQTLSSNDAKFWKFSWHEFGYYDLASSIDYILSETKMKKLSLVGHSMGTTIQLVLLSMKPRYNGKVNVAVLLAPVAMITHKIPGQAIQLIIEYEKLITKLLRVVGGLEVFPRDGRNTQRFAELCRLSKLTNLCKEFLKRASGIANIEELDTSLLLRAVQHYPQGTSMSTILHFAQIATSGKFTRYNSRPMKLPLLRSSDPMEYPLHQITAPVTIYYSLNDPYSTEEDVDELLKKMPNAQTVVKKISYKKFGHLDFILHNHTSRLLYNDVIDVLNRHNPGQSDVLD